MDQAIAAYDLAANGARIRIHGMKHRLDMNGQEGHIITEKHPVWLRWIVVTDWGVKLALKLYNLDII